MKSIIDYILEGFNSPDVFYIKNGPSVSWRMSNAYPFFYNCKTGEVVMSKDGNETHMDIFRRMYSKPETRKEMMNLFNIEAFDMTSIDVASDAMYDSETVARGRVWMLPTRKLLKYIDKVDEARSTDDVEISKNLKEMWTLFIAWWSDLGDEKAMKKGCEAVIDKIKKDYNRLLKVKEYYFIDSNGDWEIIDYSSNGDISTANLKSDEEKQIRKAIQAIHLASQKEKAEFLKAWKAGVDELKEKELKMLGIKDGTYAKRNHNFSKHVVLDKNTGKYHVVYGAHIGDSLISRSIKDYINEQLITEHFVNCKNQDEMRKYGDVVWSILKKAYEYCGGIKNIESVDDLIKDTHLWKLYRQDNEIKAVICYTDRKGGRKICLIGQDGSEEGRKILKKMLEDDFRLKDRETWTGVSGKAAIVALKHGGIPVPSEIAVKFMGSKCKPYDEYWYNRPIKGADGKIENHLKIMVGNPPGHENIEAPQELIDKLIKQAAEFGE